MLHCVIVRDKQKTGRLTCKHQIMPSVKSRAHDYYNFDAFAILRLK